MTLKNLEPMIVNQMRISGNQVAAKCSRCEGLWSVRSPLRTFFRLAVAAWLACASASGADYVFVVDTSGSMTSAISRKDKRIRISTVQNALRSYLTELPTDSRVTLISFNTGIASEKEMVMRTDSERQEALKWVANLDAEARKNGDTYLWSTLRRALKIASDYSKQSAEQTVVVRVLTDGQDTQKRWTLEQVLSEFPDVDGKAIRANLVLLGDLEIRLRLPRDGFDIVQDPYFEHIFPPVIRWEPQDPRVGNSVRFFENSQTTNRLLEWRIDGTLVGQQKTITNRFTKAGEHIIRLVVTGAGGTKVSATERVTLLEAENVEAPKVEPPEPPEPMIPKFIFSPITPEPGQKVQFLASCSGKPKGYSWQIGGQEFGSALDAERVFDKEGKFEVKFIVHDSKGNRAEKAQTVVVAEPMLTVQFRAPNEAAPGQRVQFANETLGKVNSFGWDFGDGKKSTERNPEHAFENASNVALSLKIVLSATTTTGKVRFSAPHTLTVLPKKTFAAPQAAFRVIGEKFRVGALVQLLDESTGFIDTYEWISAGELTNERKNPELQFGTPGNKMVKLTVRGPGGESSISKVIEIVKPTQSINVSWIDEQGSNCPPPREIQFGEIAIQHIKNNEWVRPRLTVFEVTPPADLPPGGGVTLHLEGEGAAAFQIVRLMPDSTNNVPPASLIADFGRFQIEVRSEAAEGEFRPNLVIRPQGLEIRLNQQLELISIPIIVSVGTPVGGGALLFFLFLCLASGGFLVWWRFLRPSPITGIMTIDLVASTSPTRGNSLPNKATFELRPPETIALGRDDTGDKSTKLFDIGAPTRFLTLQRTGLKLCDRKGGAPVSLSTCGKFEIADINGNKHQVIVTATKPKQKPPVRR